MTEATPDVSIILVSYRSGDDLARCLPTIDAGLGRLRGEVIVVENAESAGTREIVERAYPRARYIDAGWNAGFAGGNNIGVREARAEYVLLLNPDTAIEPGSLERLHAAIDASPDVAAAGPKVVAGDGLAQASCWKGPSVLRVCASLFLIDHLARIGFARSLSPKYYDLDEQEPTNVDAISGCCFFSRRSVMEALGGFDEAYWMYAEENDLCARMRSAGHRIVYVPTAVITHFGGAGTHDFDLPWRLHVEGNRDRLFRRNVGGVGYVLYLFLQLLIAFRRSVVAAVRYIITLGARNCVGIETAVLLWRLGLRSAPAVPGKPAID